MKWHFAQNLIPPVAHLKITQYIENKTLRHIILWLREYRLNLKFNTDIPLKVIILSVIFELSLSVRGVGRRTQPIMKLLNDLLITSTLNPFSELLPNLYYSPIKKLAIVYDLVEKFSRLPVSNVKGAAYIENILKDFFFLAILQFISYSPYFKIHNFLWLAD
jgi:hypothetical protein